jgi:hypothetical protein
LESNIDEVLSLNNSTFDDFVDYIYSIELEIKNTTDTDMFASYLDLHLEINSEGGQERNVTAKEMITDTDRSASYIDLYLEINSEVG